MRPGDRVDRAESAAGPAAGWDRLKRSADVLAGAGLALVALVGAIAIPSGSTVRLAIVLPILLVVPGYLLLQALLVPARPAAERGRHLLVSVGLSPAVLGLLALSTAIVPGGFTRGSILAIVTAGCLVFAGVALRRRWSKAHVLAAEDEEDVTQTA